MALPIWILSANPGIGPGEVQRQLHDVHPVEDGEGRLGARQPLGDYVGEREAERRAEGHDGERIERTGLRQLHHQNAGEAEHDGDEARHRQRFAEEQGGKDCDEDRRRELEGEDGREGQDGDGEGPGRLGAEVEAVAQAVPAHHPRRQRRSQVGLDERESQKDGDPRHVADRQRLEHAERLGELADRDRHGREAHEDDTHPHQDAPDVAGGLFRCGHPSQGLAWTVKL